jgi:hypothetical protein
VAPVADKVAEFPAQIAVDDTLAEIVGVVVTVKVRVEVFVQPAAVAPVTV